TQEPALAADGDPATQAQGLRVLIVDEHPSVRAAIRRAVAARDLRVVAEVGSADEAGLAALETDPDVILLENELDDAGGHRVVRSLRKLLPHAAIVLLAISFAEQDVVDAMQSGATGFLEVGIGAHALQRAVRGAVRGDLAMSGDWARRVVRFMTSREGRAATLAGDLGLTSRELEVLRLLSEGLTARQIGAS